MTLARRVAIASLCAGSLGCGPDLPPPPAHAPARGSPLGVRGPAAEPPANPIPSPTNPAPTSADGGAVAIGFDELSRFPYVPADLGGTVEQIPAALRRLDGRRVVIEGHMLVLEMEGDLAVRRFVLTKYQLGCCGFGRIPTPNEWIVVDMVGTAAPAIAPERVRVEGTLEVGREIADEAGSLLSIYHLRGEVVEAAPHLR